MIFRVSRGYATVNIIRAADLGLPVLEGLDSDVIFVFFPTS
jgi:V-type H+-transporting ATPase subunit a